MFEQAIEYWAWIDVPRRVQSLYKRAAAVSGSVARAMDFAGLLPVPAFWNPDRQALLLQTDKEAEYVPAFRGISGVCDIACSLATPTSDHVKLAAQSLQWLGKPHLAAQTALGGPNPLTSTIVSGLLGAGLGLGAGHIAETVLPRRYLKKGPPRSSLALLGGLAGAALPLARGAASYKREGLVGLFKQDANPVPVSDLFRKASAAYMADLPLDAGTALAESIPVDAFNNAVWNDVRAGGANSNPYGTKSPWGNNEQRLFTPLSPPQAALATGLVSGIGSALNKDYLSPADIARGLVGAGIGGTVANVFAGVAGALFGVSPEAQAKLQDMGAIGGFFAPLVNKMFR